MASRALVRGLEATRKIAGSCRRLPLVSGGCASSTARCARTRDNRRPTQHSPRRIRGRSRALALPLGACCQSAARNTRLRSTALQDDQIRGPSAGAVDSELLFGRDRSAHREGRCVWPRSRRLILVEQLLQLKDLLRLFWLRGLLSEVYARALRLRGRRR